MLNRHFSCFTHAVFPNYDLPRNLRSGHGKGGLWKGCRQLKGHRHGSHLHEHASNARVDMVQNHQAWLKIRGKSWVWKHMGQTYGQIWETMEVS